MGRVMKRMDPQYVIDICAYLSDGVTELVERQHPNNVKGECRLTDNAFDIWTSVIDSVMSELTSRKFDVTKREQSKDGCSHSFRFCPVSETGEVFAPVQIRFGISDHQSSGRQANASSKQMFRSFTVNDSECPGDLLQLMNEVGKICDRLKVGDYSSVTEL